MTTNNLINDDLVLCPLCERHNLWVYSATRISNCYEVLFTNSSFIRRAPISLEYQYSNKWILMCAGIEEKACNFSIEFETESAAMMHVTALVETKPFLLEADWAGDDEPLTDEQTEDHNILMSVIQKGKQKPLKRILRSDFRCLKA